MVIYPRLRSKCYLLLGGGWVGNTLQGTFPNPFNVNMVLNVSADSYCCSEAAGQPQWRASTPCTSIHTCSLPLIVWKTMKMLMWHQTEVCVCEESLIYCGLLKSMDVFVCGVFRGWTELQDPNYAKSTIFQTTLGSLIHFGFNRPNNDL